MLAEHFLIQFCRENNKPKKQLSTEAMKILERYSWPGNVRELRNIIERLVIMSRGDVIESNDLPQELEETMAHKAPGSLRDARHQFESNFIRQRLESNNWNITETARQLGIERTNLHRKMRQYGISRNERV